jgi:molybdopterin converting factor small subunit
MDSSSFWRRSSNSGLYINGLGALLFMELPSMYLAVPGTDNLISVIEGQVSENVVAIAPYSRKEGEKEEEKKKTEREVIQEVQDELFELIASYGHTLRLKPQESIVLNVNLGARLISYSRANKSPSRLVLQLKKKDLDDYNSGIITLANLRNKLIRQTY